MSPGTPSSFAARRKLELTIFLVLTILLAPAIAVVSVGGYGFAVWMYQIVAGPPGAPVKATLSARPALKLKAQ